MTPEVWRRLPYNTAGTGRQLALSESLFSQLTQPALYWYTAHSPAVVLGASQKLDILGITNASAELAIYRRASGGTLMLSGEKLLSLDVALPPDSRLFSPEITGAYRWFGENWVTTLAGLGIGSRLVGPDEARTQRLALDSAGPFENLARLVCFGTLSPYEVVALDGRKLVGLSQVRRKAGILLQAGVYLDWPAADFVHILNLGSAERVYLSDILGQKAAGLNEMAGRVLTPSDIIAGFEESLEKKGVVRLEAANWSAAELEVAAGLEYTKFTQLQFEV